MLRIGVLYPLHSAEDDYPRFAEALAGAVQMQVVHTSGPDAHNYEALLDLGSTARLDAGAAELRAGQVDVGMWACTSGSFVFGPQGAALQARRLADQLGVPASSTSLAFVAACRALGLSRICVAATYPEDIARRFQEFLTAFEIQALSIGSLGHPTGEQVGRVSPQEVLAFARTCDHPQAEAILIPDTALHTIAILDWLEQGAGKPVLTANQVTVWYALRLAGCPVVAPGLGRLMLHLPAQAEPRPGRDPLPELLEGSLK